MDDRLIGECMDLVVEDALTSGHEKNIIMRLNLINWVFRIIHFNQFFRKNNPIILIIMLHGKMCAFQFQSEF